MTLTQEPAIGEIDHPPHRSPSRRTGAIAVGLGAVAVIGAAVFAFGRGGDDDITPQLSIDADAFVVDALWSPDASEIGVLDEAGFSVYDASTGTERGRIDLIGAGVPAAGAWTTGGEIRVVVGSQLFVHDAISLEQVEVIDLGVAGGAIELLGATVSADGTLVAYEDLQTEDGFGDLVVVDTASGEERRYDVAPGAMHYAFDDGGLHIGFVTDCDIECVSGVIELATGEVVSTSTSEGGTDVGPDIDYVGGRWYAGVEGGLVVHDLEAGSAQRVRWPGVTRAVAVDPQNRSIASGDGDFGLELRDLDTGDLLGTADLGGHNPAVARWSPGGGRVVVAGAESVDVFAFGGSQS